MDEMFDEAATGKVVYENPTDVSRLGRTQNGSFLKILISLAWGEEAGISHVLEQLLEKELPRFSYFQSSHQRM